MLSQEAPRVESIQPTERERILQGAGELVVAIAAHYVFEERKQLPENCPFVFFDNQSGKFILGDVFIDEIGKKSMRHSFGSILVGTPEIENAVTVIDAVIGSKEEGMVYFIDQATCDVLAGLKGTTIERLDPELHGTLQRPVGTMPFVLPKEIQLRSAENSPKGRLTGITF